MALTGWSRIPRGYAAVFEPESAPWWLRWWTRAPFVDRFAYPVLVRRGFGYLVAHPGTLPADREPVPPGWKIRTDDVERPGSTTSLS